MASAFVYMYFVGFGTSLGVATTAFIGWKVVSKSRNKTGKKIRRSVI